jgi:uncharacterized protein YheU (UPF0270 family)
MLIPYQEIPKDTLYNLIESFVLREGTDYGMQEASLEDKVEQVMLQLKQGVVVIQYSEEHESVNIVTKESLGL